MADVKTRTEDWKTLPWKHIQRNVFRLQQRIYQAERRRDHKQVHNLQRLLLRRWSARCLAVRQVTQDNRGKRTPGVDGVANLTPKQRMTLVEELEGVSNWQIDLIRRTHIAKRGSTELRGLGIPTMRERAMQALARMALKPQWEAKFEPNSYGFRPGRSAHDAIEAILITFASSPSMSWKQTSKSALTKSTETPCSKSSPPSSLSNGWYAAG